jgi:hypothetical protein
MSYTNGLDDPTAYFQTKTYSGNGVETAITNDGNSNLQPDLIWFKARSAAYYHGLFDVIRGTELRLSTNVTDAESSKPSAFTSFDSNGFTVGADVSNTTNTSGQTFVAWQWKANGAGVSNTDGSITSTVSANTTSGFSIVRFSKFSSYIGNGNADGTFVYTGFKPAFIIAKRSSAAGRNWIMFDNARDTTNEVVKSLEPSNADAEYLNTNALDFLSNGIKIRDTNPSLNSSGATYIYMAFAENPFVTSTSIPTTAR